MIQSHSYHGDPGGTCQYRYIGRLCGRPAEAHAYAYPGSQSRPAEGVQFRLETTVPDVTVAVDPQGRLVLHTPSGVHAIRNLDTFIAELELARAHQKRIIDGSLPTCANCGHVIMQTQGHEGWLHRGTGLIGCGPEGLSRADATDPDWRCRVATPARREQEG